MPSFTQYRARRLGLPAPSLNPFARNRNQGRNAGYTAPAPAPSGIKGWINDKLSSLRSGNRSAGGAYESTSNLHRNDRRGFGPLDPDEAWDARVGNEYYEEQELGLQDPREGPYGGSGYGQVVGAEVTGEAGAGRAPARQRELDQRYDEEMGLGIQDHGNRSGGQAGASDPFADHNAMQGNSMRGVSPRPIISNNHKSQMSLASIDSPSERRSMFRENM